MSTLGFAIIAAAVRLGPLIPPDMVGTLIIEGWAILIAIGILLYAAAREWRHDDEGND